MDLLLMLIAFFYNFYLDNEYSVFLYKKLFKFHEETGDNDIAENENNYNTKTEIKENELKFIENLVYNQDNINDNTNEINAIKIGKDSNNMNKPNNDKFNRKSNIEKVVNLGNKCNVDNVIEYKSLNNNNLSPVSKNPNITEKKYLNNDLKKIINPKSKTKLRTQVEISSLDKFCLDCCTKNYLSDETTFKERYLKKKLLNTTDKLIESKTEILELWKLCDQFSILKKVILNENQSYMLKNKGLKLIVEKINIEKDYKDNNKEVTNDSDRDYDMKEEVKRLNLKEYYKKKKISKEFNYIDDLLWFSMEDELKEIIIGNI